MQGFRLKIIRHGKTEANSSGIYAGITDIDLTQEGKNEIILKKEKYDYGDVQKVYSSPLVRCLQTAEILFPNKAAHKVVEMQEMNFGSFEGKSTEELVLVPEFKDWLKGGMDNTPPFGESMRSVLERNFEGFDFILRDMMGQGITSAVLVTHNGILMNSLACFGLPKLKPMEFSSEFGEGYELLFTTQMWHRSNAFEILGKYPYNND